MKKTFALLAAAALLLSGCAKKENADNSSAGMSAAAGEAYPAYFEYAYESESPEHFAVSGDGRLFITLLKGLDPEKGLCCDITEYAMDGSKKTLCEFYGYPDSIAFMGGRLYTAETVGMSTVISALDTDTGEKERYAEVPLIYCAISGNESELFAFGEDPVKKQMANNGASLSEDIRSAYRISGGSAEELPVSFPTSVCARKDGGAIIAGREADTYYIVLYKDGGFSDKVYSTSSYYGAEAASLYRTSGEYIENIAEADSGHIVYTKHVSSSGKFFQQLCASGTDDLTVAEILPDKGIANEVSSAGGYCFFQESEQVEDGSASGRKQRSVIRIRFSDYYRYSSPLTFICSEYSGKTPYGCGYSLDMTKCGSEEMALKILSQDKDYDLCYLSTRDDISYSIKSKGSFYPLNDVPGVKEYIDRCFPGIREAFTDGQGNIWAIPVRANSLYILSGGGSDFSDMTAKEFISFMDGLSDEDMEKVSYTAFIFTEALMIDYLAKNDTFDTPAFRETAELLKNSKRLNMTRKSFSNSSAGEKLMGMEFSDNYLLPPGNAGDYKVSGVPVIYGSSAPMPYVTFLSINPESAHFDDALGYIEALVKHQSGEKDTFIFEYSEGGYSAGKTVRQMAELSSGAKVYFQYPAEIYWSVLEKYLSGEITLDDFIKEADRKLKMYLNE